VLIRCTEANKNLILSNLLLCLSYFYFANIGMLMYLNKLRDITPFTSFS